jgi:hypothetical protein
MLRRAALPGPILDVPVRSTDQHRERHKTRSSYRACLINTLGVPSLKGTVQATLENHLS